MNEEKKDLEYWKNNCEEDYITTPISVLRYIGELEKAINKNSVIPDVSVSDSSDFELQRLFEWLQDTNREPAQTKFTAGIKRNVAREFEYLLKHSR